MKLNGLHHVTAIAGDPQNPDDQGIAGPTARLRTNAQRSLPPSADVAYEV
jgi:hypothetical protein